MTRLAGFGLAIALPILPGAALFLPLLVTTVQPAPLATQPAWLAAQSAPRPAAPPPVIDLEGPFATEQVVTGSGTWQVRNAESRGKIDLFGNEVSDAVAKYSVDPAGSLYELHSPQTELPRLRMPKS